MEKKLIWFFLLLGFLAISTFTIFASCPKDELTKTDYLSGHFMAKYHRLDLRSQWLTKIPNICNDYHWDILLDIWSVDLWDNQISSINNDLGCLIHLQELDLSYNQIESIDKLWNLINLISLQLQNNQIKKISGLDNLKKLFSLNLWHNQIHSADGIENLSSLQELQLQYNQISNVDNITKLKSLNILNLESNQISSGDFQSLQKIKTIQELSTGENK